MTLDVVTASGIADGSVTNSKLADGAVSLGNLGNDVLANISNTVTAFAAPLTSPTFSGTPTAPTPTVTDNSTKLATTAFVRTYVAANGGGGLSGGGTAPLDSPAFTGNPTAPTPSTTDNSTSLATTAFVQAAIGNGTSGHQVLTSPTLTGTPTAPTPTATDNSDLIATTAFVVNYVTGHSGGGGGGAPLNSPNFTGVPTAPTPTVTSNSTQLATTAFVQALVTPGSVVAPTNSPALTGTPTAPTPTVTDSSTTIATTAFVSNYVSTHTSGNSAPLNSPNFTGTPTAPTVTSTDNSNTIATTAFVHSVASGGGGGGGTNYVTYLRSFNNGADWGTVDGNGNYTITTTASTHGVGTDPIVQVYNYNGSYYQLVFTDALGVYSNGDVFIEVPSNPDNRFNGRISISGSGSSNSTPSSYLQSFNSGSDWGSLNGNGSYTITIPAGTHGKGSSPKAQVFSYNGSYYSLTLTDTLGVYPNGDVFITVPGSPNDDRFAGRISIF